MPGAAPLPAHLSAAREGQLSATVPIGFTMTDAWGGVELPPSSRRIRRQVGSILHEAFDELDHVVEAPRSFVAAVAAERGRGTRRLFGVDLAPVHALLDPADHIRKERVGSDA